MNAEMVKLQEENRVLRNELDLQSKTYRTNDNTSQPVMLINSQPPLS